ncbi:MAG: 1-hydroxycarotenoid 3,4-desaturase CrtD [Bosea sp. (in: a-proteobacteria)]
MGSKRVVIVGAGIGGLAAALDLASAGLHVTVLERAATPGGKMRQLAPGGAAMDAGPTVFTMRHVFEALFARAGAALDDHVTLTPLDILARHAWTDGSRLDLFASVEASIDAIGTFAGKAEAERFRAFSEETRAIYALLDRSFMQAEKPGMLGLAANMVRGGLRNPLDILKMRPFETMWSALGKSFTDPRLRQLFGRYATYCGSSPFYAPATLMLIAHAEQAGVWSVKGGMHALARAICDLARAKGASFRFNAHVTRIRTGGSGVEGVELADGEVIPATSVIFNGDCAALGAGLLGPDVTAATPLAKRERRSLSAIVSCHLAETSGFPLIRHNVFFSSDYPAEFANIFGKGQLPDEPTVYVCAQDRDDGGLAPATAGKREGAPEPMRGNAHLGNQERLLILVNAPANGDHHDYSQSEIAECEDRAARLMAKCGLVIQPGAILTTTPTGFNQLFPATGGGLYGQASHGWQASFLRPGSRTRIPGLYLAGGSVHPGPGVPMAAMSGALAAASVLQD